MKIGIPFITVILLFLCKINTAQSNIEKYYNEKKYEKCIKLCEDNIKKGNEKQKSLVYKAKILVQIPNDKFISKVYPDPHYEALKCIKKLVYYKKKKPEDRFYSLHKESIDLVIDKVNIKAEDLFQAKDFKGSIKLLHKLKEIFPEDSKYCIKTYYDNNELLKCILLCEKDIRKDIDRNNALLYISLILTNSENNKELINKYPKPYVTALSSVDQIYKDSENSETKQFIKENSQKIKIVISNSEKKADLYFSENEMQRSYEISDLLHAVYPDSLIYIFKIAKTFKFNTNEFLYSYPKITEEDYREIIYGLSNMSNKYFSSGEEVQFLDALDTIFNSNFCDLETASTFLVMYRKNYPENNRFLELENKYREKYWQIEMLLLVNEFRVRGCICGGEDMEPQHPVILSNCLTRTTQKYAELCQKESHFSHTGPDGSSPWDRANDEGCYADGENIAWGSGNPAGALSQWMNSPGHCKNIMGSHTKMGIGHGGFYWVQLFK